MSSHKGCSSIHITALKSSFSLDSAVALSLSLKSLTFGKMYMMIQTHQLTCEQHSDTFHPSHAPFPLHCIKTITARHCKGFFPQAVRDLNSLPPKTDKHKDLYNTLTIFSRRLHNNNTNFHNCSIMLCCTL